MWQGCTRRYTCLDDLSILNSHPKVHVGPLPVLHRVVLDSVLVLVPHVVLEVALA